MRHGIVSAGLFVLALTLASWIGFTPADDLGSAAPPSAVVLELAEPASPVVETTTTIPATTTTMAQPVSSPAPVDTAESFLRELNALRGSEGLGSLTRRVDLDELAQSWADTIAADGSLRHSELIYDIITGSWTTAGENLGYGPSAPVIFAALEASPGHLANMVNADFTSVGIGVVRVGDVLWTAHLFAG